MRSPPKLSVVTPSFNQARFIEETILSVLSQTHKPIEYIIVDGGSTDGTIDIINNYRNKIDVVIVEPDLGSADALNKGFSLATGDYLAFLNSDDTYDPGFAASLLSILDSSDADILYSDVRFIDSESTIIRPRSFPLAYSVQVTPQKLLAKACIIPQQGSIWTRRVHDWGIKFNVDNSTCWDLEFFVDSMLAGFDLRPVHQCYSSFRLHESSITGESIFSSADHVNSRAVQRKSDHARIRAKLLRLQRRNNLLPPSILKLDNLIRKTTRLLSSHG
jgi:glycosyltransferase involved in cell wall biosynthesis